MPTKKRAAQLDRDIAEALGRPRSNISKRRHHATRRDVSPVMLVGRDALLEGSAKSHETALKLADEFRAENFADALQAYADALTASAAKHVVWTATGTPMLRFVVDPKYKGKRYARIRSADIGIDGTQHPPGATHSFVDLASGAIYKPASSNSPKLNFTRGSIYDLANAPTHKVHGL